MITTIEKLIDDERGAIAIETTFICIFFSFVLSFVIYQSVLITLHLNAFKLASQVVSVISQRNILFDSEDLSDQDMEKLSSMIERFYPDFKKNNITIIVESTAYATGSYKKVELDSQEPVCRINKPLDSYGINIVTSYGRMNGVYRVTVCLKTFTGFIDDDIGVVSESAIEPGHYH